jgi:hypothetical protein
VSQSEIRAEIKRLKATLKSREKARKAQFRLDRWRREHRHTSLNRYAIQH